MFTKNFRFLQKKFKKNNEMEKWYEKILENKSVALVDLIIAKPAFLVPKSSKTY